MAGARTAASDWRTWRWYANTTGSVALRSTAGRPSSTPAGPTLSKSAHGDPDGLGFRSTAHSSSEGSSNCAGSTVGVRTSWWCWSQPLAAARIQARTNWNAPSTCVQCCLNVRACTHQRALWAVSSTRARERGVLVEPQRMSVKMRKRRCSRLPAAGRPSCCQKAQRLAESSVLEIWSRWTPWTSGGTCRNSASSSPPETW